MFKLQTLLASTLLVGMTAMASAADRPQTVGPKGEAPTPVATLELTDAEVAKVAEGNYTDIWNETAPAPMLPFHRALCTYNAVTHSHDHCV